MEVTNRYKNLERLNNYGVCEYIYSHSALEKKGLLVLKQDKYIIKDNWIEYRSKFQSDQDFLFSLFCFEEDYQQFLVEIVLLTAIRMRETEDLEGLETLVSNLSKLSSYAISVLTSGEVKTDSGYSIARLEERLKSKEELFQDLNRLIFDGPPYYQRVIYYLKQVQAYEKKNTIQDLELGKKIDDQWRKGRKISTNLSLVPLKESPLYTLVPFIPDQKIEHPQFQHLFTYPWKLFVFLCCIVRENFEAQGLQAVRFQAVGDGVDVLLTANNNQQFRYGSFDEFALEFCHVNQYQLFPNKLINLHTIFQNLVERKLLTVVDDEYRLPTTIEDLIYNTRLFIPLIAGSEQLRGKLEQWIDELRDKR